MDRKEVIVEIQNEINKFVKNYTIEEDERELFGYIFEKLELLKKPQTLAEFLGWEEDSVYERSGQRFKVKDDVLYIQKNILHEWAKCYGCSLMEYKNLRKSKKVQPKKYQLKLKKEYVEFFDVFDERDLLILYKKRNLYDWRR